MRAPSPEDLASPAEAVRKHLDAVASAGPRIVRAGKLLLNMAGTAYGQGITSTSISMNGFSRSVTTSQSAMYGINSAMELVFQSYTDSIDWERLRRAKRGLKVYSVNE